MRKSGNSDVMHKFNFKGYALEEKTVGRGNESSSRINLPLKWFGKKVAVVLLEEIKEVRR